MLENSTEENNNEKVGKRKRRKRDNLKSNVLN